VSFISSYTVDFIDTLLRSDALAFSGTLYASADELRVCHRD
jgi:hypothetical protein